MSYVSRNDMYARDEKGGEWFDQFLRSMADQKSSTIKDVLDAIQEKRGETVKSVIEEYRKMVGLDAFSTLEHDAGIISEASRPLSIRHAEEQNAMDVLKNDHKLQEDVRSLCEHSGGTKNTISILNFLRDRMGKGLVSYSDKDLLEYIEQIKSRYYEDHEEPQGDVGRVGTDSADGMDSTDADYITHGKGT